MTYECYGDICFVQFSPPKRIIVHGKQLDKVSIRDIGAVVFNTHWPAVHKRSSHYLAFRRKLGKDLPDDRSGLHHKFSIDEAEELLTKCCPDTKPGRKVWNDFKQNHWHKLHDVKAKAKAEKDAREAETKAKEPVIRALLLAIYDKTDELKTLCIASDGTVDYPDMPTRELVDAFDRLPKVCRDP
jgi:hypothetical protein